MAVVAPVWNIIYSLGLLMGIGGSVIFSTKRGSEKCDGSENQYFTSAVIGAVILSILAWIGAICFERPILTFFEADGSYHCPHLCVILPAAAVQHLLDLLFPGDHEAEGSVRCFCGTGLVISGILIMVLPALVNADAIWFAMPVTDLLVMLYAASMIRKYTRALPGGTTYADTRH